MRCPDHLPQLLIDIAVAPVGDQPHDRKLQGVTDLTVPDNRVSAVCPFKLFDGEKNIPVIVSDDDYIVAVVRNRGCNRSSTKSEILDDADTGLSSSFMPLKYRNLVQISVRLENNLLREAADLSSP